MSGTTTRSTSRGRRAARLGVLAGAAALAAGALVAAPATAAEPAAGDGWLRVMHLSPDTKQVDVAITAVSGGESVVELDDVGYGAVSPYSSLDAGSYVISMRPAGSNPDTAPAITASVDVAEGEAATVAAYGPSDELETAVFEDDLTQPAEGQGRIRLIQASTVTESVDVATSDGTPIAAGATSGSATGYATVAAQPWTLELTGDGGATGSADVDVASGSVITLLVLDDASGGLTIQTVLDSAAAAAVPQGGVDTGAGGLSGAHPADLIGAVTR